MKEHLKIMIFMEQAHIDEMMEGNILGLGKRIKCMERAKLHG